jgi:predicted membrane chloride channel (bestrophin family)
MLRVVVTVALIMAAKSVAHYFNWEPLSVNPLFTGIVAANVFLMGFLLSGVLADYKESERIPGELSACLENMATEVTGIGMSKSAPDVRPCLTYLSELADGIQDWMYKRVETSELMERVNGLTAQLAALEPSTQVSYIVRLKQEQSNLRRTLTRVDTIRETSFVSAGYLLADIITVLLCTGLVLIKQEHDYEAFLFTGVISCLLIFLSLLIRDLDNPFGYYEASSGADVSLKPLQDTAARLRKMAGVERAS